MGSQSPSADARPGTRTATPPARKLPDIHLDIVLVVFCGGAIGTAIRYAFAQIPAAGSFHTGTFVANMPVSYTHLRAHETGQVAAGIAYLLVTFALGLVCASAGVWAGTHLTGSSNVSAEASADTNAATTSKGGKA